MISKPVTTATASHTVVIAADLVAFLASPRAASITGTEYVIDGGNRADRVAGLCFLEL